MKQYRKTFAALFLLGIFILSLTACKKEPSAQYSTWVVDGDTISTNEVSVDRGKATLFFLQITQCNYLKIEGLVLNLFSIREVL